MTEPAVTKDELVASFGLVAATPRKPPTTPTAIPISTLPASHQRHGPHARGNLQLQPGHRPAYHRKGVQIRRSHRRRGQSIEEVGGGICQVSSTLFNAVARANLEIVSRSPHAWPSTYVNIGEDATVNWPNLDFQFKNNTKSPIFIINTTRTAA